MLVDLIDKLLYMFISVADLPVFSLYRREKDAENIGIIVINKHVNGLEVNLECVIITFSRWFSVFNVSCIPWLILMPLGINSLTYRNDVNQIHHRVWK